MSEYEEPQFTISNNDLHIPEVVEAALQANPFGTNICMHESAWGISWIGYDPLQDDYYSEIWCFVDEIEGGVELKMPYLIVRANSVENLIKITNNSMAWTGFGWE